MIRGNIGHAIDVWREGAKSILVGLRLVRHGHREECASVERTVEHDDAGPTGDVARNLDGVLDGLGAIVEQSYRLLEVARSELGKLLADGDVRLVWNGREVRVEEVVRLVLDSRGYAWMRVADRHAAPAAGKVNKGVAVNVGYQCPMSLSDPRRRQSVAHRCRDDLGLPLGKLDGFRSRDCRLERYECSHDNLPFSLDENALMLRFLGYSQDMEMATIVNEVRTDVPSRGRSWGFGASLSCVWALSGLWRAMLSVPCFGLSLGSFRRALYAGRAVLDHE